MNRGQNLHYRKGFTIVELLVVIVVIGILAAIAIVAYTGVTNQAKAASLQSELSSAAKKLEVAKTTNSNGQYPESLEQAGIPPKDGVQQTYRITPTGYCVAFGTGNLSYNVRPSQAPTQGSCEGVVSTVAGTGVGGSANGSASAATFMHPQALEFSPDGTLYIADSQNHRIRKLDTAGQVTTLVGTTNGFPLSNPAALAIDATGMLYVSHSNRVDRASAAGAYTAFVGSSSPGTANGTGSVARFTMPQGMAIAANGDIFVADMSNNRIRKVLSTGEVQTFTGSNPGLVEGALVNARFRTPKDVAIATDGTLYVLDYGNHRIRKITTDGIVSTFAGSTVGNSDGIGSVAQFNAPEGLAIDAVGNLYVADTGNCLIRQVSPSGVVSTLAGGCGTAVNGVGLSARFSDPTGVAVSPDGSIYVADWGNHLIRRVE